MKKSRGQQIDVAAIEAAARKLQGAIVVTPLSHSRTLSDMLGCEVWLKFENQQFTGSFKERGALNRLLALAPAERARGVVAMSAGNHAQGVAYHAKRLGIPATIVMPIGTPANKVRNTRALGAKVVLHGASLEEATRMTRRLEREQGLVFIHPFDDPAVIAGQGTIGLEMLSAGVDFDDLVVPIGGGGLLSGIAIAARSLAPATRILGVEAQLYPAMFNRLKAAQLPIGGDTLAEGIAVKEPGRLTAAILSEHVDDIILVSEPELERAVSLLIDIEKTVVEGAGAAGLAAILASPHRFRNRRVGLVLCGGNIDTRLLASVLTRELAREGRLARLTIDIPDRPGQLAQVAGVIGLAGANIIEVYHQRVFTDLPAKGTELNLVIETRDASHLAETVEALRSAGYRVHLKSQGLHTEGASA